MSKLNHREAFSNDIRHWAASLNLNEDRRQAIIKFCISFDRSLARLAEKIARKTGRCSEDYYQEGICLLLEYMNSREFEKVETSKLGPFFYKYVHDGLFDYFRNRELKHLKHTFSLDVLIDEESGLIFTVKDLDPAIHPEKCLLTKEAAERQKLLAPLIKEMLAALPEDEQKFINAVIFKQKSFKQLAQELDLPLRKTYRRAHKLLQDLRQSVCLRLLLQPELKRKILAF